MEGVINDDQAYNGIVVLISFLIVFRTQTGYHKFWEGTDLAYQLIGDISDGCSDLIAYCEGSKLDDHEVQAFQHLLIRLASLLSAVCFAELAGGSLSYEDPSVPTQFAEYELIDFNGLDDFTKTFMAEGKGSPEVVYQWIQILLCRANNMGTFGVPPPVLTRAYQDMGLSMIRFHQAQKIVEVPFPLPYVVALQLLLFTHWVMTPIITGQWTNYAVWAGVFAFTSTISLWFFFGVAMEMDAPFRQSLYGIDCKALQRHLNGRLLNQLQTFEGLQPALNRDTFQQNPELYEWQPQGLDATVPRESIRRTNSPNSLTKSQTHFFEGNSMSKTLSTLKETASEEEETTSRTADSVEVTMPLDGDKLKL